MPSQHRRLDQGLPSRRACSPGFLARPYQGNPTFDPEFIRSKSTAAAGLCSWCINIVRFYEVYCDVAPKRQALEEANAELAEAQEKLSRIKNKIAVSAPSPTALQNTEPPAHAAGQQLCLKWVGSAAVVSSLRECRQRWAPEHAQGHLAHPSVLRRALGPYELPRPTLSTYRELRMLGIFPDLSHLTFQELNANLSNLTSAFEKATAEKIKCQQEADATNRVISLANR